MVLAYHRIYPNMLSKRFNLRWKDQLGLCHTKNSLSHIYCWFWDIKCLYMTNYHPGKLTWQWNMDLLKMYSLLILEMFMDFPFTCSFTGVYHPAKSLGLQTKHPQGWSCFLRTRTELTRKPPGNQHTPLKINSWNIHPQRWCSSSRGVFSGSMLIFLAVMLEVWFRSFSFLFMGDGCRFQLLIFQGVSPVKVAGKNVVPLP